LLFNARSEGIAQANFWKDAFHAGRAIAPGDAIFEWKEMPKGQKKPKYEITIPGQEPFGTAAVWKLWKNPKTAQWERTFAILPGDPNELVAPIHPRMKTFVEPRDYNEYLTPAEKPPLHLLRILPADRMRVLLIGEDHLTNRQVNLFDSQ
jgi:putative SOS response-associated peptidase YedK